jgi:hypothetical protein
MARTDTEIQKSLIESIHAVDPSVDVVKGPVYDFLIRPVPSELAKTEQDAERLTILTTLQLDQVATQAEIEAMATSFSLRLGGGKASKTTGQVFYAYTKPIRDAVADRGTLVGTQDQRYTYFVSEKVTLPASSADNFYNPQNRRYEITAKCEATAVGPDFDLPPYRVNKLITKIAGIDGTENISEYRNGQVSEDLPNSVARVQAKFAGLDPESGGGISSDIRNYDAENVSDVSLVYPKDRSLFKRLTNRPAIDAYVIGEQIETLDQTYVALGGETTVQLTNRPVRDITTVKVNGIEVDFSFIPDTTRESGGSPRSTDYVLLAAPLVAADVAVVTYRYNYLAYQMQQDLFVLERPFDTDVLVREPRRVGVWIELDATVVASFDTARVSDAIQAKLFEEVETGFFIDILQPETIRQDIRDQIAGVSNVRVTKFRRTSGGILDVETIEIAKNETPYIDQGRLKITVRR